MSSSVECPLCDRSFSTSQGRGQHLAGSHDEDEYKQCLIDDLDRVRNEVGSTPTQRDINEYGKFSKDAYQSMFGSHAQALIAAGMSPNRHDNVDTEDLIDELQSLASDLGKVPTERDVEDHSKYSASLFQSRFGSFNQALEEAGYEPNKLDSISKDELIEEIHRLADELGRRPTTTAIDEHSQYSRAPFVRVFGTFTNAMREAGYEPVKEMDIDDADLLDEIHRLKDELGRAPSRHDMNKYGRYAGATYARRWGLFTDAVKEAGLEPIRADSPSEDVRYYGRNWKEQREKTLIRDDYECVLCGAEPEDAPLGALEVHHITPVREFGVGDPDESVDYEEMNSLDNLVSLCPKCHRNVEGWWSEKDAEFFKQALHDEVHSRADDGEPIDVTFAVLSPTDIN